MAISVIKGCEYVTREEMVKDSQYVYPKINNIKRVNCSYK